MRAHSNCVFSHCMILCSRNFQTKTIGGSVSSTSPRARSFEGDPRSAWLIVCAQCKSCASSHLRPFLLSPSIHVTSSMSYSSIHCRFRQIEISHSKSNTACFSTKPTSPSSQSLSTRRYLRGLPAPLLICSMLHCFIRCIGEALLMRPQILMVSLPYS